MKTSLKWPVPVLRQAGAVSVFHLQQEENISFDTEYTPLMAGY